MIIYRGYTIERRATGWAIFARYADPPISIAQSEEAAYGWIDARKREEALAKARAS